MWGTGYALRKATVMRTRILSVTPLNPSGAPAPLINKGSQENCVNAIPCRRYNPSGFSACETSRKACSPSIRSEAPSFIVARAAKPLVFGAKHQTQNVVRQSRTNILPKIHRGAEIRAQFALPSTEGAEAAPPQSTDSPLCESSKIPDAHAGLLA